MKSRKNFTSKHILWKLKKLIIILRLLFPFLSAIRNVSQSTKWEASIGDDSIKMYTLILQTSGFYPDNINILQCIYFWIMPILTLWFNTKPKLYCPHRILQGSPVSFRNAEEKHWLKVLCSLQNSFKVLSFIEISTTNCFLFVKRKRKNAVLLTPIHSSKFRSVKIAFKLFFYCCFVLFGSVWFFSFLNTYKQLFVKITV